MYVIIGNWIRKEPFIKSEYLILGTETVHSRPSSSSPEISQKVSKVIADLDERRLRRQREGEGVEAMRREDQSVSEAQVASDLRDCDVM